MSLLSKQPEQATKLKELQNSIYSQPQLPHCSIHQLPKQLTCLQSQCPHRHQLVCRECHPLQAHSLISVKHIVPKMVQWLSAEWTQILRDHKAIESEWKHCLVNVDYCLDILKEIKTQIQERSQKVSFPAFNELLNEVYSLFHHQQQHVSADSLLKRFATLNKKYHLLEGQGKAVSCQIAEQERHHNTKQVQKASHSTKAFSQSALAFSQQLASIIEEKLNYQKRVSRLKQISQARIFTLKDLIHQQEGKLEQVGEVMLEVGKQKQQQKEADFGQLLIKCPNIKSLRVSSRSHGAVEKHKWRQVIQGMEYLKFLKELILNLRSCDLPYLTQLFKDKNKAVRQVQKLSLTISDQKDLNVKDVWEFVNTMELRNLHLILTRDSLQKQSIVSLLKNIRLQTSMSQLPLSEFVLNLSKNNLKDGKDIAQIHELFHSRAGKIKQHSLIV